MRHYFILALFLLSFATLGQTSWRGTASSSWNSGINWTNGVPNASTAAIIGDASFTGTFQPSITSNARCLSLTVGVGSIVSNLSISRNLSVNGAITIGANGTITHTNRTIALIGSWTNNGSYAVSGNTTQVAFNGSTQTLSGATVFRRLEISAGSNVTLTSPITITGRFQSRGTFDPGNNLVTLTGASFILRNSAVLLVQTSTFSGNYSINPTSINNNSVIGYTSSSVAQSIAVLSYGHIIISGIPLKTFSSTTTQVNDLTNNGTFSVPDAATLQLRGDWINNGTFNANLNTIEFLGTVVQNVSGTTVTNFNNILVSNTSNNGVRIQSDQNLTGVLTLVANATFDADGQANTSILTLLSSADNPTIDGHISTLPSGAQVTGNVTIQRYMAIEGYNNNRIYRYISSPVQNGTVADIQNEIPITGSFTGTSTCTGCSTNASMFLYDESVLGNLNNGYLNFPTAINSETLSAGTGYAMFVRGNILGTALWDIRGTVNSGNISPISFPVTYTTSGNLADDGWNLAGNPFPSTIDWNAASGWTKTNLDATIYITDNGGTALQFATWNGVTGTNGGSRYIAMGQGFWVKANAGSPGLSANENVKSAGTQTIFFRATLPSNLLRITLTKGIVRDEAVIHFRDDATDLFDSHADAIKLPNATINLSSQQPDGEKLAINSIAPLNCEATIPIVIENANAGDYQLSFTEYESFGKFITITLHDTWLGTQMIINAATSAHDFSITSDPESYASGRFEIQFSVLPLDEFAVTTESLICKETELSILLTNARVDASYTASIAGGDVYSFDQQAGDEATLLMPTDEFGPGLYTIDIVGRLMNCDVTVGSAIELTISAPNAITTTNSSTSCGEGSVTLTAQSEPNSIFNWYESEESAIPLLSDNSGVFVTEVLAKSKTFFVSSTHEFGCGGERVSVTALVNNFDPVQINLDGNLLTSNYAGGNQWFFNDQLLASEVNQVLSPLKNGTYKVEINNNGCLSTDSIEYTIELPSELNNEFTDEITNAPTQGLDQVVGVYPNPFTSSLRFHFNTEEENIHINITDSEGRLIKSFEWKNGQTVMTQIDLADQPSGIYIVSMKGQKTSDQIRVLKK